MKYDAHASALDDAYGMLAELRRELSDTREDKNDREELLDLFATCKDSQRAWILLRITSTNSSSAAKISLETIGGRMWWRSRARNGLRPCRLCSSARAVKCLGIVRAREPQAVQ